MKNYINPKDVCNKCGYCLAECTVYKSTIDETYSPRGLLNIIKAVENGEIPISRRYKDILNSCIGCMSCADNCPTGLKPFSVIQKAKEKLVEKQGLKLSERLFCNFIAKNQWLIGKSLYWGSKLGQFEGSVPKASGKSFYHLLPEVVKVKKPKGNVGFFAGCAINLWYQQIGVASVKLLTNAGFQVTIPKEQKCCGSPVRNMGNTKASYNLVQDNLEAFKKVDFIVSACPTCCETLKNEFSRFSKKFGDKVKEINYFLVDNNVEIKKELNKKITYHDPCHLNRGLGISEQPRQLLQSIDNVQLIEAETAKLCCGGGGSFRLYNQELSMQIAKQKIEEILSSGTEILATSCPGCIMQFNDIFAKQKRDLPVNHVVELLAG